MGNKGNNVKENPDYSKMGNKENNNKQYVPLLKRMKNAGYLY